MSIQHNPNVLEDSLALLLSNFQKPNIQAMIQASVNPLQDLEDTIFDLADKTRLDTAVGVQLDVYGLIVGASRNGLLDDEFRRYIRTRLIANRSNGQGNTILQIVQFITEGTGLELIPSYPASFHLQWTSDAGTSLALQGLLARLLSEVVAAGVDWTATEGATGAARFDVAQFDVDSFGDRFSLG